MGKEEIEFYPQPKRCSFQFKIIELESLEVYFFNILSLAEGVIFEITGEFGVELGLRYFFFGNAEIDTGYIIMKDQKYRDILSKIPMDEVQKYIEQMLQKEGGEDKDEKERILRIIRHKNLGGKFNA